MDNIIRIEPVLSSSNLARDIAWYEKYVGFNHSFGTVASGYIGLTIENSCIHLQWHHDNDDDPVLPTVVKFFVKDIQTVYKDLLSRGTVTKDKLHLKTAWNTHEIGFYDLNGNAIYFVEDL